MRKNVNIARNLGYMDVPEGVLIKPSDLADLAPHEAMILCTGSQGEPLSAMTRVAYGDHPTVSVERGDTVIISARPVPGNELRVHDTINRLTKAGAEVLHQENAPVHVTGHAQQEELRTMIALVRPKAIMPIHGEFRMQAAHARLARDGGVPEEAIVLAENGSVVELPPERREDRRPGRGRRHVRGRARRGGHRRRRAARPAPHVRGRRADHRHHARARTARGRPPPELIARGFAEPEPLLDEMRDEAAQILRDLLEDDVSEIKLLQEHLHDGVGQLIYDRTRRRPMILPVRGRGMSTLLLRGGWARRAGRATPRTSTTARG